MASSLLQKAVARARESEPIQAGKALVGPLGLNQIAYTETRVDPIDPAVCAERRLVANLEGTEHAQAFSTLAIQLLLKMRSHGFRSLAIVAPTAGTGASLVAANVAVAMAREPNHSVLLVDADLRVPGLNNYFGINVEYGLLDHLSSNVPLSEILVNPGVPKLVMLPGRGGFEGAAELLASRRMTELIAEVRRRYDSRIVLYDMPPLLGAADALSVLPQLDCALLVIQEGRTSKKELESAKRILQGVPMIGAVVNQGRSGFGRR